jgi:hypothetical protein
MDLNSAFRQTCKILLGEEVGDLTDFAPYLREALLGKQVKSSISGKDLWLTYAYYPAGTKFFDYSTERQRLPTPKISINDIKDIDSLFSAVAEQAVYTGNKVLGNSIQVVNSDNVSDSSFVQDSSIVMKSKFIAYSYLKRNTQYAFACTSTGNSSYVLRCFNTTYLTRCFECSDSANSSDLYFGYNLIGCNNCFFTFNSQNKRNMIANIQLTQLQYDELKKKLLAEFCGELKAHKRLGYSILNLFGGATK